MTFGTKLESDKYLYINGLYTSLHRILSIYNSIILKCIRFILALVVNLSLNDIHLKA